jgi:uncharacterized coiled-coil protein SlyX
MVLACLIVGVVVADTTFTVDTTELILPESGMTQTFTLSVCGATGEYQVWWAIADWHDKYEMPALVSSNVQYVEGTQSFVVMSPDSGTCNTFDFRVSSKTTPERYKYEYSPKEGQYFAPYENSLRLNVTVIDLEMVLSDEESSRISDLESKIASQEEKIAMLQISTTTTPETNIPTFGELIEETIETAPAYTSTPLPTSTIDYETRIEELNVMVETQQRQIEEQQSWIDKIIGWLWPS